MSVDGTSPEKNNTHLSIKFDESRYTRSVESSGQALPSPLESLRNTWLWPMDSSAPAEISQFYGEFLENHNHNGIDIQAPIGTSIIAPHGGKVLIMEDKARNRLWQVSLGDVVHDENLGLLQEFAHLDLSDFQANLKNDQLIEAGQVIGKVGEFQNGDFSNPHLHYGVEHSEVKAFVLPLIKGLRINPLSLLRDLRVAPALIE